MVFWPAPTGLSAPSGRGEQQPGADVVEAAVARADALQCLLLIVGEVLGRGPDRANVNAVTGKYYCNALRPTSGFVDDLARISKLLQKGRFPLSSWMS